MIDAPHKTLDKLWTDYATKVLPPNASPVQVAETKKAFYAGAYSILTAMVDQVGDEEDATEEDMDMVGGFFTEAEQFLASQIKGASA
jgi:hypothetical protein